MRAALLALLALLAPAASAGELTFWDGAALRTGPDPRATAPVLAADLQTFATLAAPGVGLVVEPAEGAAPLAANLIGGALVRRFAGHVEPGLALGAGRVVTLAPRLARRGADAVAAFRLRDAEGRELAAFAAAARMARADLAAFGPETAERIAFQAAAQMLGEGPAGDALRAEAALSAIGATPDPLPRPGDSPPEDAAPAVAPTAAADG